MDTIFLIIAGIAALSGLLAVMIYLLAVSREMQLPDVDEVWEIDNIFKGKTYDQHFKEVFFQ